MVVKVLTHWAFWTLLALIALGAMMVGNQHHIDQVCGGTRNPAMCQLSLMADKSDAKARADGDL